jgi:hypothetical protein
MLAAVALVALIGAGCANAPAETGGGGGANPASGSNATGGTDDRGDQTGPGGTAGPVDPKALQERRELAKCMRENGVEDFPDPDANGAIIYNGDDPDMASAREKCHDGSGNESPGSGG